MRLIELPPGPLTLLDSNVSLTEHLHRGSGFHLHYALLLRKCNVLLWNTTNKIIFLYILLLIWKFKIFRTFLTGINNLQLCRFRADKLSIPGSRCTSPVTRLLVLGAWESHGAVVAVVTKGGKRANWYSGWQRWRSYIFIIWRFYKIIVYSSLKKKKTNKLFNYNSFTNYLRRRSFDRALAMAEWSAAAPAKTIDTRKRARQFCTRAEPMNWASPRYPRASRRRQWSTVAAAAYLRRAKRHPSAVLAAPRC